MAPTPLPREWLEAFRRREIELILQRPSYMDVLAREEVPVALDHIFSKFDMRQPVIVTRTGEQGAPRGHMTHDRDRLKMWFFLTEFEIPWLEDWLARNRGANTPPLALFGGPNDQRRIVSQMMDAMQRRLDEFHWNGDTAKGVTGMVDRGATGAITLSSTVDSEAGRQEFVESIVTSKTAANDDQAPGVPVMAIDENAAEHLGLPYLVTDGAGAGGVTGGTAMDLVRQRVSEVVVVRTGKFDSADGEPGQGATHALDTKALIHYRDIDTASYLVASANARGVSGVQRGQDDNRIMTALNLQGSAYYRAGEGVSTERGFYVIDGLLA